MEDLIMVKVSVVMPVYNAEEYLKDSLESLINQTLDDIEIICVNDGSSDNSLDILKDYEEKDSRIIVLDNENQGASLSRNEGMAIAKGEYIYFMDADDKIDTEAFEFLYENAENNRSDFVMFKLIRFNESSIKHFKIFDFERVFENVDFNDFTFTHRDIKGDVLNTSYAPWTKFYRKKFLEKNNFKFPDIPAYNDILFHVKSMLNASRISFVPKYLHYYRLDNPNSITNDPLKHFHIFEVIDSIEDFLVENDFMEEYKDEFDLFKLKQISRHAVRSLSKEYFIKAKEEFEKMDFSNNDLVLQKHLDKYDILMDLSLDEFDKVDDYLKLNDLKKENKKLAKQNKKLKRKLKAEKKTYEELSNSISWKLTKPFRKLKK